MELIRLALAKIKRWLAAPSPMSVLAAQMERMAMLQADAALQQTAQVEAFATVVREQAAVMQKFLKSFEISEPPRVRVTRDEDEFKAEMMRKGVPPELVDNPLAQSHFLLSQTMGASDLDALPFSFPPSN